MTKKLSTHFLANSFQKLLPSFFQNFLAQLTNFSELPSSSQNQLIDSLYRLIHEANQNYYKKAEPFLSDHLYDQFYQQLFALEKKYPQLKQINSPTSKIGNDLNESIKKITHQYPMISLANAYNLEDLKRFEIQNQKVTTSKFTYISELKIDGVAISATYDKGKLIQAATRGNGIVGDDITQNIQNLQCFPKNVLEQKKFEIRGELYMTIAHFKELYQKVLNKQKKKLVNPRNTVAGSIKLKNQIELKDRKINAFTYFLNHSTLQFENYTEELNWLKSQGFSTNPIRKENPNITSVHQFCLEWETQRKTLPYQIDGIVIKVNSKQHQANIGETNKHPRWAIAYKFITEKKETTLLDIQFQVGRTGKIVPVAYLESVFISGSTISRASLYNADELQRLDLKKGDRVLIEKAGEIIPKVIQVTQTSKNNLAFVFPKNCPVCQSPLSKQQEKQIDFYCISQNCSVQLHRQVEYFVGQNAMNIVGVGTSLIEKLLEKKLISSISDIYRLSLDQLLSLDKVALKSAQNILTEINKSKEASLEYLITGLGIHLIGKHIALTLAQYFKNLDNLEKGFTQIEWGKKFISIPGIGNIFIDKLLSDFQSDDLPKEQILHRLFKTLEIKAKALKDKAKALEELLHSFRSSQNSFYDFEQMLEGLQLIKKLKGIGHHHIQNIVQWFSKPNNQTLIADLKNLGLKMEYISSFKKNTFSNKIFVLTGTLPTLSRKQAQEKIIIHGGKISNSVSLKTDFILYGENAGSKLAQAKKLEVSLLTEVEFLDLLKP